MAKKSRKTAPRTATAKTAAKSTSRKAARRGSARTAQRLAPVFARGNFVRLGVGAGLLALGYVLMALDGTVDGFVALTIAPVVIAVGYGVIVWSALHRAKPAEAAA